MENKWLRADNSVKDYGLCAVHFLSLPFIYKPSFISILFVLSKSMAQKGIHYKTKG